MPVKIWKAPQPRSPFAPNWAVPMFVGHWASPQGIQEARDLILARRTSSNLSSTRYRYPGSRTG